MAGGLFGGGNGTSGNPYLVEDADDLNAVRNNINAHYLQVKNIDLTKYSSGAGWLPITANFQGTYDGGLYSIIGLKINRPTTDAVGLFSSVAGNLRNIRIIDANIVGRSYVGALVGYSNRCYRCTSSGSVSGSGSYVGGLIGWQNNASAYIDECSSTATVQGGTFSVGGLCGSVGGGIKNSYSTGNVSAGSEAGGLADNVGKEVTNCYATGLVTAPSKGGLLEIAYTAVITSSYYDTNTSGCSDTGKGEPKTTAEMKNRATYEDWDFGSVWRISPFRFGGYPYLAWQEYIDQEYIPNYPPQSYIELNFTAGDSDPYPMGRFYIDRTSFAVGNPTVAITGRNSIGKYLKDQTFDERNYFPTATLKTLFEQILLAAGITNYHVAANNTLVGMEFPPNMEFLTGAQELLKLAPGWIIREEISSKVVIGPRNDANFTQPSKCTFYRNRDIFSRESIRDDNDAYGRVCCHTADYSVRVYRPVPSTLGWLPAAQKTFYVPVPDGTRSAEAASLAVELAEQMANSGEVETFVGPYRPHLIPGDQAEIIDADGPNLLGVITTVEHSWSKGGQGFITGITVDSGGKIGKPQLREFIDALSARQRSGAVKL